MPIDKCHSCGIPAHWRCDRCQQIWCMVCGLPHTLDCGGTLRVMGLGEKKGEDAHA